MKTQSSLTKCLNISILISVVCLLSSAVLANSAPQVSNVTVSQRSDDSKLVDIHYNLADADGDNCTVWIAVSNNGGTSWKVPARSFTGAVGSSVSPGSNKHVIWDAGSDMAGMTGSFKVRVFADDGNSPESMVLVSSGWFPYQNTSNPESWVFVDSFMISKYELTNAEYCQYLNNNQPDSDSHWDGNMEIDRYGEAGAYNYEVQAGKHQHPVRYVSYNDAVAYINWKSNQTGLTYRLPTEQEWEKAAGWDPVAEKLWTYGYQSDSHSCSWINYNNCVGAPRPVGYYNGINPNTNNAKSYYGCYDMSGNLWEWTSSIYSGSYRVIRGGIFNSNASSCTVTYRSNNAPSLRNYYMGFRLVLDLN